MSAGGVRALGARAKGQGSERTSDNGREGDERRANKRDRGRE